MRSSNVEAGASSRALTSLQVKLFTNGFDRPCHVVSSVVLGGHVDRAALGEVLVELAASTPLFRSKLEVGALGVPTHFRFYSASEWRSAGAFEDRGAIDLADLADVLARLLAEDLNPAREFLCKWFLFEANEGSLLLCKMHHAIVDSTTAPSTLAKLATLYRSYEKSGTFPPRKQAHLLAHLPAAPRRSLRDKAKNLRAWAEDGCWSPEPDPPSLVTAARLSGAACHRLRVRDLVLDRSDFDRITAGARTLGLSFAQAVTMATLRAQHAYNESAGRAAAQLPTIGMRVAYKRNHGKSLFRDAPRVGPALDSIVVSAPRELLIQKDDKALAARVLSMLDARKHKHYDFWIGLYYATRRISAWKAPPSEWAKDRVFLSYSDGVGVRNRFGAKVELAPGLPILHVHAAASPMTPEQIVLLSSLYGSELRLTLNYVEGVIDGERFLALLRKELCLVMACARKGLSSMA